MMSEEQFNKLLERLTGKGGGASVEERRTQKIDWITTRLTRFEYDPENGITFSHWYERYGEMLTEEGADLNEATRRRLLFGALGEMEYNRFANRVLPKKVNELSWNETVKALKTCFAATKAVFQERFEFLRMSYSTTSRSSLEENARCFGCNEKGHCVRFCPNSREASGQALVVGSVHASKESVKIREMVKIKTVPIEMMVDTGSDVTMLSVSDWEKIGKPRLKVAREKILTVDKKPMKIMGSFECNFKWRDREPKRRLLRVLAY
ncbi:unnamed protein product [Caenorhabditis sp. 36 PRJEB53466]|nr:unnamed protein product [Caenorhabditis sp. 36 PRJEB53466]